MVLHLAAVVPQLPAVAKFIGTQIKDPAKRALAIDPLSKAFRQALEYFVAAFEAEYKRHETLTTLLGEPTKDSLSAFVGEPSAQAMLAGPFVNAGACRGSSLEALWKEIRRPTGEPLVELQTGFDWEAVVASYLDAVRTITAKTPELRETWVAMNLDDIRGAAQALRGVPPRFSIEMYRRALIEEFGTLRLSAIHADYNPVCPERTVSLQKVYVGQRIKEAFPPRDVSRDYRRRLGAEGRLFGLSQDAERENLATAYERAPVRRLGEVLDDRSCQRLVILGDPGLGKSTLLQHLALDWTEDVSTPVPFLIELRKYTRDHAHPKSFLEFMEMGTWSNCRLPQGELDRHLRDNGAVVLFDGLDEIFDESLRGNIVTEVINFARDYEQAQIIVTTRVVGYAVGSPNPEQFRAAGFRQFTLQDFGEGEIREFISKWYAAAVAETIERSELTARLTGAISGSRAIRELAGNPLLLTLMAMLNRRKHLPHERIKLYEACAELLVEGWDAARHLERSAYLTHDDKIEILQRVACEMQHERQGLGGNMISETRLRAVLVAALRDRSIENPGMAAQKIVNALAERDFMLCSVGDQQFSFVHRTFLEYYCAKEYRGHLENGGSPDELVKVFDERWRDDAWHEVLRLICGMVGPDLAGRLIRELLSARHWRATMLAAECIGEIRQVGKVPNERAAVHQELTALIQFHGETEEPEVFVRQGAVERLARFWPREKATRSVLMAAAGNMYWKVRFEAVEQLVRQWPDNETRQWLLEQASRGRWDLRQAALHGIAMGWPEESTRRFIVDQIESGDGGVSCHTAIEELSTHWPVETTRQWLLSVAVSHSKEEARSASVRELVRRWPDAQTKSWLLDRIAGEEDPEVAQAAAIELGTTWQDEQTEALLMRLALEGKTGESDAAIIALAYSHRSEPVRELILNRMREARDEKIRYRLVMALGFGWPDKETRNRLTEWATSDPHQSVRAEALSRIAAVWNDDATKQLLMRLSIEDTNASIRVRALTEFARHRRNEGTKQFMLQRLREDPASLVREAARKELLALWSDDPDVSALDALPPAT